MLPPIRALPRLSSDPAGLPPAPILRQRMDLGAIAAEPDAAAPPSVRIEIGLLSARLRLQYSFAMFAEAAGQAARLTRRESETLADFAQRVADTLKAMPPQERASTEPLLNQMFKGISFRVLTDILSDASGVKAARLALQLEAIPLDRDQAAKAVVSSYRQNEGGEIKGRTNPPPPLERSAPQGPGAPRQGRPEEISVRSEVKAVPLAAPQAGAVRDRGEASSPMQVRSTEAGSAAGNTRPATRNGAAADAAAPQPKSSASAAEDTPAPAPHSLTRELPARKTGSQAALHTAHVSRTQTDKFAIAALTEWLAQALGDESENLPSPSPAAPSALRRALPEQVALRELFGQALPETNAQSLTERTLARPPAASPSRPEADAPAAASRLTTAGSGADRFSQSPADPFERGAAAMPLPPILREGLAPPAFVPYPAQEPERDPERRRTRAISETDEDGEPPQSGGQDAHGNEGGKDGQGNGEGPDEGETPHRDEDGEGRPDELYWRMAGWN